MIKLKINKNILKGLVCSNTYNNFNKLKMENNK